jgi:hypothetical protein
MANRIEQEIAIKIIGGQDVKALEKQIKALEKQKAALVVSVDVDDDEGRKKLDELDKQLAELKGEKAEIEVTAKVDRAISAIEEVAQEAKRAEAAAEALSVALGPELAATADLDGIVSDFQRMGLSLDEITANADRLGASLRDVGSRDIGGRLTTGFQRIDSSARSAGSSASVLANAVGNTTQDLAAMGGIAGTTGVALGQMGEYMVDAKNSGEGLGSVVRNFAKVAGPIAALSAGMLAFSQGAKQAKERTDDFTESVDDLASASDRAFDAQVMQLFIDMFFRAALDGKKVNDQLEDMAKNNTVVARRMLANAEAIGLTAEQERVLAEAVAEVESEEYHAARTERMYGNAVKDSASSQDQAAAAQERRLQAFEDRRQVVEEAIEQQKEFNRTVADAVLSYDKVQSAIDAFADAQERVDASAGIFDSQRMQAQVEAADSFAESLKAAREEGVNLANTDLTPDTIDELTGATRDAVAGTTNALASWRESIQAELTDAFSTGGLDKYTEKFDFFARTAPPRIRQMFQNAQPGISTAELDRQVQEVLDALGLLPETKKIQIRLTHEQELRNALDQFGSVIDGFGEEKQIEIRTLIAQGDIQAAFDTVNRELIGRGYSPIVLPTDVDMTGANQELSAGHRAAQAELNRNPLNIPVSIGNGQFRYSNGRIVYDQGGTVGPAGGIVAERGPEILNGKHLALSPTIVPPGTRVTSRRRTAMILRTSGTRGLRRYDNGGMVTGPSTINVNFNGVGAIGNQFDLMRTMRKAEHRIARLYGTR